MLSARIARKLLCYQAKFLPLTGHTSCSKKIYLTFDDGPDPIHTNKVLDVLSSFNIKATFFLVGLNIEKNMATAKRMVQEGHVLGNHTYSHKILPRTSRYVRILEIERCQSIIEGLQGPNNRIFRPPQGLINPVDIFYLVRRNYRIMLWSLDSNDYHLTGDITSRLSKLKHMQNVILFHDDNNYCIEPLISLLPIWIEQGFEFVTPNIIESIL